MAKILKNSYPVITGGTALPEGVMFLTIDDARWYFLRRGRYRFSQQIHDEGRCKLIGSRGKLIGSMAKCPLTDMGRDHRMWNEFSQAQLDMLNAGGAAFIFWEWTLTGAPKHPQVLDCVMKIFAAQESFPSPLDRIALYFHRSMEQGMPPEEFHIIRAAITLPKEKSPCVVNTNPKAKIAGHPDAVHMLIMGICGEPTT